MRNILIISNCRLGDSIVLVPCLKLLRQHFPEHKIILASENGGSGIVGARDILDGRGLVDVFQSFGSPGNIFHKLYDRLNFILSMRLKRFDAGIVLFPPCTPLTMEMVERCKKYLRLTGVPKNRIFAPAEILEDVFENGRFQPLPSVVDLTLPLLQPLGIPIPEPGMAELSLPPKNTAAPLLGEFLDEKRPLIAVGASANMPCKIWPVERYAEVLKGVPDFVPVYFGGSACREICGQFNNLHPGYLFVNHSLDEVEALMRHCRAYLGNDTGLMHLAAALGLPCAAIFSCRQAPGLWEPYTKNRIVFRTKEIQCENCNCVECKTPGHPCMSNIEVNEVLQGLRTLLKLPAETLT